METIAILFEFFARIITIGLVSAVVAVPITAWWLKKLKK